MEKSGTGRACHVLRPWIVPADGMGRNLGPAPQDVHIFFEMGPRPSSGNMLFVSAYYRAGLRAVVRAHVISLNVVDRVNLCGWYGRGPNRLARFAPRGNWQRERHRFALRESVAHTPPNPPEFQKENSDELVSEQKNFGLPYSVFAVPPRKTSLPFLRSFRMLNTSRPVHARLSGS